MSTIEYHGQKPSYWSKAQGEALALNLVLGSHPIWVASMYV